MCQETVTKQVLGLTVTTRPQGPVSPTPGGFGGGATDWDSTPTCHRPRLPHLCREVVRGFLLGFLVNLLGVPSWMFTGAEALLSREVSDLRPHGASHTQEKPL